MVAMISTRRFGNWLAALCFVTGLFAGVVSAAPPPAPLDGHFALTTLDGRDVTDADYRGKWLLIYFGYTFCPDVCPTTLTQIGGALDVLGPQAKAFQPIFITVDPARDKVPVLRDYMKSFDSRIVALTGEPDDIETSAKCNASLAARAPTTAKARTQIAAMVRNGLKRPNSYLMSLRRSSARGWPGRSPVRSSTNFPLGFIT